MKRSTIIATLVLIPSLALAACSGAVPAALLAGQNQSSAQTSITSTNTSSTSLTVPSNVEALQSTFESIYQKVSPSVVSIDVIIGATASTSNSNSPFGNNPFSGNSAPSEALGSGFVWDTQGHIVTNNHVVAGATQITVTFLDGTVATAKVVGTDLNSDLAVIQVNVPQSELVPVTMGDSTQVKVGDVAIAIGNPYGLDWTMTQGIISALGRSLPVGLDTQTATSGPTYSIPDIIQTDAAINPGNSGGVLLNDQGLVIGVTAAITSSSNSNSGVGFVIPSQIVKMVVPSLISTGKYNHPYLGITGTNMNPDLASLMNLTAQQKGALVIDVATGGPAATAGLQGSTQTSTVNGQQIQYGGDIITAIDGQPVQTMDDLSSYLFLNTTAGQSVKLTILRQGKEMTLNVTTGILPVQ
jgi:serine protease Do